MENDRKKDSMDPEQRKWDRSGPEQATERTGGGESRSYNQGKEGSPSDKETTQGETRVVDPIKGSKENTDEERRFSGSHTAGTSVNPERSSEWKGGTPDQGPTTGGMGSAGGGHDTEDETDVWGDRNKKK